MVLISFKDLYEIHIFPEFHRCGSKIVPATPFWNLNFKWAWQAQFLSHTFETLEKYVFFIDLQMILVPFFDILNQKFVIGKRLIFCSLIRLPWYHFDVIIPREAYREQKIKCFLLDYRFLVSNIKKWY